MNYPTSNVNRSMAFQTTAFHSTAFQNTAFRTTALRAAVAFMLFLFVLSIVNTAQARNRNFWFGVGGAESSFSSSDLNTTDQFEAGYNTGDAVVYGVDIDDGTGFALNFGWAFSQWLAVEMVQFSTSHDATNQTKYPGETLNTDVDAFVLAVRPMIPLGPLEVFGRFGFGAYTVSVDGNVEGTSILNGREDSSFSGSGTAYGAGIAIHIGRLGLEGGITRHNINLEDVSAGGYYESIPDQKMSMTTASVILSVNWGKDFK